MIHHQVTPAAPLAPHTCGRAPVLIEARGRSLTDARLFGKPARMFHVECCRCGVATPPVGNAAAAVGLWAQPGALVDTHRLPVLRLEAERALAAAA